MIKIYKILRAIILSLLGLAIFIPMSIFVAVSLPSVQEKLCKIGEEELCKLLGTNVEIQSISITPLTRLSLKNVTIKDDNGADALNLDRIGAGIDIYELLSHRKMVITHATIIGLNANLYKETPSAPLNIKNIIDNLKPKNKNKPPKEFDLRINTIVIRESQIAYNVKSIPEKIGKFDPNHIYVSALNADIQIPQLKNNDFIVDIKRFQLTEKSGLNLSDLNGVFHISSTEIATKDVDISLQNSSFSLSDISIKFNGWGDLKNQLKNTPINVAIKDNSHLTLNDLAPFVPKLRGLNESFNINLNISGALNNQLAVSNLDISHTSKPIKINANGTISGIEDIKTAQISIPNIAINANAKDLATILDNSYILKSKAVNNIAKLGNISINGQFNGQPLNGQFSGTISTHAGNAKVNTNYSKSPNSKLIKLKGDLKAMGIDIGKITNKDKVRAISGNIKFDLAINGKQRKGHISGDINDFEFNKYHYSDISTAININNDNLEGNITANDPNLIFSIDGSANVNKNSPMIDIHAKANTINLDQLNFSKKYARISAKIDANFNGFNIDNADGYINIHDIHFSNNPEKDLYISHISIDAQNETAPQQISIASEFLNATVDGSYSFKTIIPAFKEILSHSFPALFNAEEKLILTENNTKANTFEYYLTLTKNDDIFKYFNISTELFAPITIIGEVNHPERRMSMIANIPYIAHKNKLIEKTRLEIDIDQSIDKCFLRAFSILPTKHGNMPLEINCNGSENRLDANINWEINRKETFKGNIDLSSLFSRDENNKLITDFNISPSKLIFNDTTWTIQEASIHYSDKNLTVDNFDVRHDGQFITIEGKASPSANDILCVNLKDVNLDYIFQTLEISKVLLGGDATGTFYATQLFSKNPIAYTPKLSVKDFRYNSSIFGDATIKAKWDNQQNAVILDAYIDQANGDKSYIDGMISPTKQTIDLKVNASKLNIGFLKPFMSGFSSDISGTASGYAHLFGTFKNIDLEGDVATHNINMRIKHTNTAYTTSDSIHFRPGLIELKNIFLTDEFGNHANLNGWFKHKYFRAPTFDFNITNAKNLLCYNTSLSGNEKWYGRIFGSGFAHIDGTPGVVNINVEMETMDNSSFTFILSDMANASDYKFLTFRDKDEGNNKNKNLNNSEPIEVLQFRERIKQINNSSSSTFNMRLVVNATPKALITVIVDPIGGDKIKARGNGELRINYESGTDAFKMYGPFEIDEGSYNFTLQDIILKEFKLKNESKIQFNGDPYSAILDISALYPLKANLSDLDESFTDNGDFNYSNVSVNALLHIKNNLNQPDISFDLEFPTLGSDVYNKVKSIVSTDEMMKRQVLYLLALNRFYTPEYMSATKGNEFFSVASSTLSSQISSMLGQLSENWTITPNLRSDQGDFSDVEVDIALSSSLLNNRLRFNGNFGYRDKTLNTNQFIGDFDLEYLLNPRGSWRLKAYNRYNDQNYYLKTATTTQGIGIMYRQDFDNLGSFFNEIKGLTKLVKNDSTNVDSVKSLKQLISPDSIISKQHR